MKTEGSYWQKVLIVEKLTDLECIQQNLIGTDKSIITDKLRENHDEHMQACKNVYTQFKKNSWKLDLIKINQIKKITPNSYDLVVALGGDGTFLQTCRYLSNPPILGIQTQLQSSVGHLTRWNRKNFVEAIEKIKNTSLQLEIWPRIGVWVDGRQLDYWAVNEVYFGVSKIYKTSHYNLQINGLESKFHGNGVLVSSFEGSSGFYKSAAGKILQKNQIGYVTLLDYKSQGDLPFSKALDEGSEINIIPSRLYHSVVFDGDEEREVTIDQGQLVKIKYDPKNKLKVVV